VGGGRGGGVFFRLLQVWSINLKFTLYLNLQESSGCKFNRTCILSINKLKNVRKKKKKTRGMLTLKGYATIIYKR
jgi:hypothetical protein